MKKKMLPHPTTPTLFMVYVIIFFLAILIRYFVAAGIFYGYYYVWRGEKFREKRLSRRGWRKGQIRKEIIWSIKSSAIFAAVGAGLYWLWQKGYTAIYLEVGEYGYWYLPISLIIILLIHETYYYWVHRWMHDPKIFRTVHKVHHDSLTPTPWTAFAFHPWESIIEAIVVPLILLVLPVHVFVLGFYLMLMTVSSVMNHLDIEVYPERFQKSRFGKLFIGATHHHYHHSEFNTNYGLYFTFWDKWMGTESTKMEPSEKIQEVKATSR
ncbi:sterol desaturase family protein [Antarcticibacterium sp. 1MA-6-2]|uniref:sterol desaturase family protein n=1 Tax=Antarcticibacterium sp. 1MA-6-2 TaxID=2908210 RepID=UPI001F3D3120|nr:sterol desaturase family protein [Antarcticibacterium sp. 1MA-6-2]UJH90379.1 sterol desaturase family protein [Antarcticibacterium sp. 1MA-6-2]